MAGRKEENEGSKVTQHDIAVACGLDQGSVSRILNKDTRDSFAEETVQKVFQAARELGYLHPALVTTNRRESLRRKTDFHGKVAIVVGTSTIWDTGSVEIREMSGSGMLLKQFQTTKNTFPIDCFKCDIEITGPRLKGFKARCKVVRFSDGENEFALAVKFDRLDDTMRARLKQHFES